jgi:hypothetical protein
MLKLDDDEYEEMIFLDNCVCNLKNLKAKND